MLFGIIRVVRVWCDIMVSATILYNNGGRLEGSVAGFQKLAV